MRIQTVPAPAPPAAPAAPAIPGPVIAGAPRNAPNEILDAFREQRSELRDQLERLENQRNDLRQEAQQAQATGADKTGIEARIVAIDARIAGLDKQIAEADLNVARAAAVPGAVVPDPPEPPRSGPPEEFFVIMGIMIVFIAFPLAVAYARRIWKRTGQVVSAIPQEIYERFNRVDQAVDAIAVEVERIGENQRFLTRAIADEKSLGAGPAERVEVGQRDAEKQPRR